ncbi:MAG: C4-dicarboxylate ABC transporter substrate-binding protein [Proteobacteria bacterium]|nr:MAG: C4-dicarboxylate ABC transporter substrate-binding protein [Pseudomonadota bacterium]
MRKIRLRLLSRRDLAVAATPVVIITLIAFAVAFYFVKPAPPRTIVMASGQHEGRYGYYAKLYQQFMAKNGIKLDLHPSSGSVENMALLSREDSTIDVGFVQGGTGFGANAPDLVSLGALYYEPLWVFYRGKMITDLDGLRGRRIAIGAEESGTRALALQLLAMNGAVLPPTALLPLGGKEAEEQLLGRKVDAIMVVAPADSNLVQRLATSTDRDIKLLSFDRAEAYTRLFPYLTKLTLPRGVFDLARNIPAQDVTLVSPTANLIAQNSLHPALAYLLMRAATEIHSGAGVLDREGEFPAAREAGFPLSDEAKRYYKSGTPFLQRYLPFWAANLVERLWVMLVPVLAVLIPMIKLIPPVYRWRVRSRIYRWYARLKEIELQLEEEPGMVNLEEMLERLELIDRSVNRIPTPLAYSENLYSFRGHIDLVRQRVIDRLAREQHKGVPKPASELQPS